ncbi:hypothetical protein RRG08_035813 [Elysia crispata]|uniref:Uncharacterized protein n=1 Tax=Elysia crispata TaxID=231223 RepID=A0AAE1AIY0_9GAST|nr:hypothetical protein RRG08_035813 [Elysia crispata]
MPLTPLSDSRDILDALGNEGERRGQVTRVGPGHCRACVTKSLIVSGTGSVYSTLYTACPQTWEHTCPFDSLCHSCVYHWLQLLLRVAKSLKLGVVLHRCLLVRFLDFTCKWFYYLGVRDHNVSSFCEISVLPCGGFKDVLDLESVFRCNKDMAISKI